MARSMGRADGRLITNGIVIINIVFSVCIAGCRRVPARFQSFTYLFLLHGVFWVRFRFHADLLCAMSSGLSRTLNSTQNPCPCVPEDQSSSGL